MAEDATSAKETPKAEDAANDDAAVKPEGEAATAEGAGDGEGESSAAAAGSAAPKRGLSFQKGVNFLKDKGKAIAESDRMQQMKGKTMDIAGSVKNKTKEIAESDMLKNMSAKVTSPLKMVGKFRSSSAHVQTTEEALGPNAWKGSAKETLSTNLQQDQWADVKILAAEEINVSARGEHITSHFVSKGSRLQWCFRVKEHSILFGVRVRLQAPAEDGEEESEVVAPTKCDAGQTMIWRWMADEDLTVKLLFDNKSSMLRGKTISYIVGSGPATGGTSSGPLEALHLTREESPKQVAADGEGGADEAPAETRDV